MAKGFGPPQLIKRRSYLVEFKRHFPDGSELDLWWWKINVPRMKSSALEEEIAKLVCQKALHVLVRLKGIRKPNQVFLLSGDGRHTLGEGRLQAEQFEDAEIVDEALVSAVVRRIGR